jgi:YbbR domain-containing protein
MRGRRLRRALLSDLPAKLICLAAAAILFLFHRVNTLTERFFSVPLEVSVPAGLAVASAYPKSVRITLRGAEEQIYPVLEEDIEAVVSLEGKRGPGVFRAPVKVTRRGTAASVEPLEVKVEPQDLTFTLEQLVEKRVPVLPDLRGSPAYGYEMVQTVVVPPSAVVRGAKSRVQGITGLSTEEIDLTGRSASFAAKLKLGLPSQLVRIAGDASVEFRATIQEAVTSRAVEGIPVTTVDLAARWIARTPLPPGRVQVRGPQLLVDGVRTDQVRLVLDCSIVKRAGAYVLHPRPEAPTGVTVQDWSPREITVEFVASGR